MALFKGTDMGKETLSLAMARVMSTIGQTVQQAMGNGGDVTPADKVRTPKQRGRRGGGGGTKRAAATKEASTPVKAPKKEEKKDGEENQPRYPDTVGAKGPNGLTRMIGGNPKGSKCKHIAKGEVCPYTSCPFSHEK